MDEPSPFRVITVGALYPGIERGLSADLLAARALGGMAYPVCTAHVVAGGGVVTDVLAVPTDTVSAQLEHLFETRAPSAAKVGIIGHPATVEIVFRHLRERLDGPFVLDLTLSGPSGEDLIGQDGIQALTDRLGQPGLVALRRTDAELIAGMEIPSLDDAQVAAQRIASLGARSVLLRCGRIATHHFDLDSPAPEYAVDLLYDGETFMLYEAPHLDLGEMHGASSALLLTLTKELAEGTALPEATQRAKGYVTEALGRSRSPESLPAPHYFWKNQQEAQPSS